MIYDALSFHLYKTHKANNCITWLYSLVYGLLNSVVNSSKYTV